MDIFPFFFEAVLGKCPFLESSSQGFVASLDLIRKGGCARSIGPSNLEKGGKVGPLSG